MLDASHGGVANYAATLHQALKSNGLNPIVLRDGGGRSRRAKGRKWLAAVIPGARTARMTDAGLVARDIFREAQVHFNLYGRLLSIRPHVPQGTVHWTYPVPLHIRGWRNLYTVHDAIPLVRPDLTPISQRRHRCLLKRIMAACDTIVTVSESARQEIASATCFSDRRIVNTSQAADVTIDRDAALPPRLKAGEFFLFAGSIDLRKNVDRLIQAHALSGTRIPLVLVGSQGWGGEAAVARAMRTENVLLLPPQPRPELLALMRNARALLFPSLAEGFGLPIAEAMTLGVPVMTSFGGATEETAGGAAYLIDPMDIAAMAHAIERMGTDNALCRDLGAAGLARSAEFGIDRYARRLRTLYLGVADD